MATSAISSTSTPYTYALSQSRGSDSETRKESDRIIAKTEMAAHMLTVTKGLYDLEKITDHEYKNEAEKEIRKAELALEMAEYEAKSTAVSNRTEELLARGLSETEAKEKAKSEVEGDDGCCIM